MSKCKVHKVPLVKGKCPVCASVGATSGPSVPQFGASQLATQAKARVQGAQSQQQLLAQQATTQMATALPTGAALTLQARVGAGAFVNVPATLYIPIGTTVEFKAAATGTGAAINFTAATWSGTAGASGAGATKSVPFNAQSASKVSPTAVTVSYSGKSATVQCVTYTLTPVVTPLDNFGGRSLADLGVDERTSLDFTTAPAAISAAEAGGLKWAVNGIAGRKNDGVLGKSQIDQSAPGDDGRAFYIAPYITSADTPPARTKTARLRLAVSGGPLAGAGVDKTFTIHTPIAHMKKRAGSDQHTQNAPSAGFEGDIYIFPKTVSFRTLRWREAGGMPDATGPFTIWQSLPHKPTTFTDPQGKDRELEDGNSATGSLIRQVDNVHSGTLSTYVVPPGASAATEVGKFTWPIYWQYIPNDMKGGAVTYIRFQTAYHVATLYQTGRMVMYKGHRPADNCAECTARVDKAYGDPTVP